MLYAAYHLTAALSETAPPTAGSRPASAATNRRRSGIVMFARRWACNEALSGALIICLALWQAMRRTGRLPNNAGMIAGQFCHRYHDRHRASFTRRPAQPLNQPVEPQMPTRLRRRTTLPSTIVLTAVPATFVRNNGSGAQTLIIKPFGKKIWAGRPLGDEHAGNQRGCWSVRRTSAQSFPGLLVCHHSEDSRRRPCPCRVRERAPLRRAGPPPLHEGLRTMLSRRISR